MPTEKKYQIFKKREASPKYIVPKTLDEAFTREYTPQEISVFVYKMFKAAKENMESFSFITPHVKEAHNHEEINKIIDQSQLSQKDKIEEMKTHLTGERIIKNKKMESYFTENINKLAFELQVKNINKIINWLCSPTKEDLILDYDFKRPIGIGTDFNNPLI